MQSLSEFLLAESQLVQELWHIGHKSACSGNIIVFYYLLCISSNIMGTFLPNNQCTDNESFG